MAHSPEDGLFEDEGVARLPRSDLGRLTAWLALHTERASEPLVTAIEGRKKILVNGLQRAKQRSAELGELLLPSDDPLENEALAVVRVRNDLHF